MRLSKKPLSSLLCILGLSLIVIGMGGTWGRAYGQTAGPTPTAGVISAVTVTKAVNPASGLPNDSLTFSIQIRNNDTTPQPNVVFNDRILDFLEIVSVSSTKGTASFSGQEARVEIGTLEAGETVTVTIIVRIRPTAQSGDSGVNIASVSAVSGVVTSNPVAISVGQAPPGTLPGTGSGAQSNPFLIGGGLILLLVGMSVLIKYRQPLKP
jgi:uncharacterized repeat protein (TIGR01451 family)/LPXTG-motif cell wall-anchored protein